MAAKSESRTERKKEVTTNNIINTAVELFNRLGIEAVTMERIAEEVDIAKGTLYNYFPSKEAIINGYLQRSFRERSDDRVQKLRQLPDTSTRMTQLFKSLISGVQAQKAIFEAFMVYRMKQVLSFRPAEGEESGLSALIQETIILGQQGHELRTDLPKDLLEDLFEFTLIEAIKPLFLDAENYNQDRSIEQCVDLFLNGAKV
jgi:AcrR family transcriptional regulator